MVIAPAGRKPICCTVRAASAAAAICAATDYQLYAASRRSQWLLRLPLAALPQISADMALAAIAFSGTIQPSR